MSRVADLNGPSRGATGRRRRSLMAVAVAVPLLLMSLIGQAPAAPPAHDQPPPLRFLGNKLIAPFISLEHGKPVGIVVDLAYALADKAGLSIAVEAMDWPTAQSEVVQGKADALLQINPDPQRQEVYDFSDTLLESDFQIFRKAARTDIQSLASLRGKKVGVESGGFPAQFLGGSGAFQPVPVPSWKAAFILLDADQIDAVIVDRWVGEYELATNEFHGITPVDPPVAQSHSRIAVKKGNTQLLARINLGLQAIKQDGTYQRIMDKWRPKEVVYFTKENVDRLIFFAIVGCGAIVIGISLRIFTYARALKKMNVKLADENAARRAAECDLATSHRDLERVVEQRTLELRRSEERLRLFIEHAPAAIAMFDRDMRYVAVSRRWLEDYRLSGQTLIGRSHYEVFPEVSGRWKELHRRGLAGEMLFSQEDWFERNDGPAQWVKWDLLPWRTPTGEVGGIIIATEDVTERRQAEAALRESEARLKKVLEVETVGVMFWDLATGRMTDANDTFFNMMGYSRRELDAGELTWQRLTPPEYVEVSLAEIGKFQATGRIGPYEKEYLRKDGTRQWLIFAGSSLGNDACVEFCVSIAEQKRAEQALRESEDKYRNLFENIEEMVTVYAVERDSDGRIVERRLREANHAFLRAAGVSSIDEIRGKTSSEVFGKAWSEQHLPAIEQAMDTGEVQVLEIYRPESGRHYITSVVRLDADTYLGTGRDITERKEVEAALREGEEQFRTLADAIPQLAWMANADGWLYWYNRRWYEYTGTAPEQMEGWGWQSVHDPETLPAVLERWKDSIATGKPFDMVLPLRGADGVFRRFLTRVQPLRNAEGRVVRWFGTNTDVDGLTRAEEALRESRARLQSEAAALVRLNEASSRLWAIRDLRTGLAEVLSAAIDLLGTDMGKVQLLDAKRGVLEIAVHRGFQPDFLEFFREVSASEESSSGRALRSHQRILIEDVEMDADYAPYRPIARAAGYRAVQSTPLIGRDGTPLGMISTYFRSAHRSSEEELRRLDLYARQAADFIERCRMDEALKQAEERRRTLQAELFQASRLSEIGRMAAALAHELNQPLAAVANYIGGSRRILASDTDDEQRKRKLHDVLEQAGVQALRAGEIIRRLREFVGSGQRERRIEDAESLMHEACSLAIASARHNGVSVRSRIGKAGHVLVDKIQFQQVVINLARNAVEAMENSQRKQLEFGLARNGSHIEVRVTDTGPGIDPKIADRLFTPFSTTKGEGMGIGLSVCREIVEAHDGKIWCEPNPGGGTVFRFTLPIVADHMVA